MERVGFGRRFAAALIDSILLLIVGLLLLYAIVAQKFGGMVFDAAMLAQVAPMTQPHVIAAFYLIYALIELLVGASPGGLLLKLRILDLDGYPPEMNTRVIRWGVKNLNSFLKIIGAVWGIPVFYLLGQVAGVIVAFGFLAVFRATRQTLQDKIAGTSVYRI